MARQLLQKSTRLLLASLVVVLSGAALARADGPISIMGHEFCCPSFFHCTPRPPHIHYKCVCSPKPICDPCELHNYGYYPVCWRPWMQDVDYSHCPVPPPTVLAPNFNPPAMTANTTTEDELTLPTPKRVPIRER
jgi:hypothetical protein